MDFYNLPMRRMARLQLERKRKLAAARAHQEMLNRTAARIQRQYKSHRLRKHMLKLVEDRRRRKLEASCAARIQRVWNGHRLRVEIRKRVEATRKRLEQTRQQAKLRQHAAKITRAWQKSKERDALNARFKLRKRMMSVMRALSEHTRMADEDRDAKIFQAEEEKHRTQQLLQDRIASAWKQGSDAYGRNYYFNYVTGEST